jgi:hypothetical protein
MDHGNVLTYLANHDNADRLQLLIQVAYGKLLTSNDLRGTQIPDR